MNDWTGLVNRDGFGAIWMDLDGSGWIWMDLDGFGCGFGRILMGRMDLSGPGRIWMVDGAWRLGMG
jgi:hypothetical protein